MTLLTRALGIGLGVGIDALLGDPRRHHPVAWFGTWAHAVEQRVWADSRPRGALFLAVVVAPVAVGSIAVERRTRSHGWAHAAATAVAVWACLGGTSLAREADVMAGLLDGDDLAGARARLSHLCGRLADHLPASELARATVESVAENTNDAVVTPLLWAAVAGIPGVCLHRAANTLDAMVGHRSPRWARFGTASARVDDVMALPGARLTGAVGCALAGVVDGDPARAWATMRRDAHDHPSPNGGWCEAAWAGALGVQLGGENIYPGGRVEHRGRLGDGPAPTSTHVRRSATLLRASTIAVTASTCLGLGIAALLGRKSS